MALQLMAAVAAAEGLEAGVNETVNALDMTGLLEALEGQELVEADGAELLKQLAMGKTVLQPEAALHWAAGKAMGIFTKSLWRMTRLMVPALLTTAGELLFGKRKNA